MGSWVGEVQTQESVLSIQGFWRLRFPPSISSSLLSPLSSTACSGNRASRAKGRIHAAPCAGAGSSSAWACFGCLLGDSIFYLNAELLLPVCEARDAGLSSGRHMGGAFPWCSSLEAPLPVSNVGVDVLPHGFPQTPEGCLGDGCGL